MFGYVRPCKPELLVREYEAFRAMYCGLCRTLGKRYGLLWRFLLNYDFCFLALVMTEAQECDCTACRRRCMAHPLHKKAMFNENPALEFAADATVLLTYHKLQDSVMDEHGLKRFGYRLLSLLARGGFRKAEKREPVLSEAARDGLDKLHVLEQMKCTSMDRAADSFASILRSASDHLEDPMKQRILAQAFYHTGRWIYILDAWDDFDDDAASGSYNPIRCRYGLTEHPGEDVRQNIEQTLQDSAAACASALELLEMPRFGGIVRNVVYQGLPGIMHDVFSGKHKGRKRKDGSL